MKNNIIYLVLIAGFLLFTMCSDENEVVNPGIGGEQDGNITFVLPGMYKSSGTYADPIASDAENIMNQLSIYMFNDSSGKLEKIFKSNTITIEDVENEPAQYSATINLTGKSGKKTFYFIINGETVSAEFNNFILGVTHVSEFLELITDKHTLMPKTPLLMTGKATIDKVEEAKDDEKKVTIKRRVARFDVVNDETATNFKLKNIYVTKANLRTYLFSDATGTPTKTIEAANYQKVDFTGLDNANNGATPSVLYLYKTVLGKIGTGKTEISFEGELDGVTQTYNLHLDDDIDIIPNTRYILKAKPVPITDIEFTIEIANWEVGSEHETSPETELVEFSNLELINQGGGIVQNGDEFDLTSITKDGLITFTAKSYNKKGTVASVKYNHGSESTWPGLKINNPTPVLTYSGAFYTQKYEIQIPKPTTKYPIEMQITIANALNVDQKKIITIYCDRYPGTKLYPVLFEGIYWAPINVGAEVKDEYMELREMGLFYQWGRNNYGSKWNAKDAVDGPVSETYATTGDGKDKFIANPFEPGDWLSPAKNDLWSATNNRGPCPAGWRVPSQAELQKIKTAYDNTGSQIVTWESPYMKIKGTNDNGTIYLPATGYRGPQGQWNAQGISGHYRAIDSNGTKASALVFDSSSLIIGTSARAAGLTVRCVR